MSGTLCQEGFAVENSVARLTVFLRRGRDGGDPLAQRRADLLQRARSSVVAEASRSLCGTHGGEWKEGKESGGFCCQAPPDPA
jgi:hypothetical protein